MKLKDLYSDPGHLIRRAHQISVAIFLEECQSFDLGLADCAVLYGILSLPGTDQISLSRAVAIDRSSIARVVDKLGGRGLIERHVSEEDRRVNRLYLTDEGKRIVKEIGPRVDEVNARTLAPLKPRERKQFISYLKTVCEINNDMSRAPLYSDEQIRSSSAAMDKKR